MATNTGGCRKGAVKDRVQYAITQSDDKPTIYVKVNRETGEHIGTKTGTKWKGVTTKDDDYEEVEENDVTDSYEDDQDDEYAEEYEEGGYEESDYKVDYRALWHDVLDEDD